MFEDTLRRLDAQALRRRLRSLGTATGPLVSIEGRSVILLASNDYLGLAAHPAVKQAAIAATERYGVGAGAARLISGTLPPHEELETALAKFKGAEAALVFGSGYLANIGLIPSLIGAGGLILADRLCHASVLDGCRLSGADLRVYRHRDLDHLRSLLSRRAGRRQTLIVTDGVFSMDGDLAPLPELADLAEEFDAPLYVDDAHGTGVFGTHGRGLLEHVGLESRLPFHMGTLGKAVGTSGAYVVGSDSAIQYFLNRARSFLFATAPPPATAAATVAALQIIQSEPERRTRLWDNRGYLLAGLRRMGYRIPTSESPIMPVMVGEADRALAFAEQLLLRGVYAPAVRPPTVPKETSRIRVTVTSEHTRAYLDRALTAFLEAGQAVRLI